MSLSAAKPNKAASSSQEQEGPEISKPKRPLSAYNLFFKCERENLLKDRPVRPEGVPRRGHGKMGFALMARTIAGKWAVIDPDTKAKFEALAKVEKIKYLAKMAEWKQLMKPKKRSGTKKAHNKKNTKQATNVNPAGPVEGDGGRDSSSVADNHNDAEHMIPSRPQEQSGDSGVSQLTDNNMQFDWDSSAILEDKQEEPEQEAYCCGRSYGSPSCSSSCSSHTTTSSLLVQPTAAQELQNRNNCSAGVQEVVPVKNSFHVLLPTNDITSLGIQALAQTLDAESIDFFIGCFAQPEGSRQDEL